MRWTVEQIFGPDVAIVVKSRDIVLNLASARVVTVFGRRVRIDSNRLRPQFAYHTRRIPNLSFPLHCTAFLLPAAAARNSLPVVRPVHDISRWYPILASNTLLDGYDSYHWLLDSREYCPQSLLSYTALSPYSFALGVEAEAFVLLPEKSFSLSLD